MEKNRFKKIIINLHYLKEKIKKKLNKKYKINILFSEEKKLLNTGGGIKNALKIINEKEFFVINSDIVWSEKKRNPFNNLKNFWNKNKMDALLLLYPVEKINNKISGDFCLDGITRRNVINLCKANDIPVFERNFTLADVYGADEAFITGTFAGLSAVAQVDGRAIGTGKKPMLARLQQLYIQLIETETQGRQI